MTKSSHSAFTLIELLVVIAIIALLASLLLPSLSRAKSKARQAHCLNAFRQWGLSMNLYLDDNDNFIPRERGMNGRHTPVALAASTNSDVWFNAIPQAGGFRTAASFAQALPDFYGRSSFFTCPSAIFPRLPDYHHFTRAMNSRLIVGGRRTRVTPADAQRLFFVEAGAPAEPLIEAQIGPYSDGRPYVKWERTSARHSGFGNGVFGDGHAEAIPGRLLISTNQPPF